jgi:predicted DNA-binding transcriptional regulator YafY
MGPCITVLNTVTAHDSSLNQVIQDQQVQYQEDGSIIITMQTSGWDDVKRWVLGFGPTAVVLEPRN